MMLNWVTGSGVNQRYWGGAPGVAVFGIVQRFTLHKRWLVLYEARTSQKQPPTSPGDSLVTSETPTGSRRVYSRPRLYL